jgi:hypothetical protein
LIANGGGVAEEALANITDTTTAFTSNTTANATTTATTTESETSETTTDEPTETTTEDSATSDDSTGDTDTESPATTQTAGGNTPAPEQPQNPTNPPATQAPQPTTPRPTNPPATSSTPSLTVGEVVRYGSVDFRVLEVRSDRALIIAERSIGQHQFKVPETSHEYMFGFVAGGRYWGYSNLCRNLLVPAVLSANMHNTPWIDTIPVNTIAVQVSGTVGLFDNGTWHMVESNNRYHAFLLSLEEVQQYRSHLGSDLSWWTRSSATNGVYLANGTIIEVNQLAGVRPAMWISTN